MTLFQAVNPWAGLLCLVLLAAVIGLSFVAAAQNKRLRALHRLWSDLLGGVDAENVERLLIQHLEDRARQEMELEQLRQRLHILESKMRSAKRFVGMVRFDAFEGVGGEQSFSLAVYDDDGNGAVLTSQVGRAESRVFGKKLAGGRSDRGLSQEEEAAVMEAAGGRVRPQITP